MVAPMDSGCRSSSRLPRRRHPGILVVLAAAGLWACSSDSSGPSGIPTTMTAMEGGGLQAPAGTVLPEGPTVVVLDQRGDPVEGIPVTFQVLEGGGTTPKPDRITNSRGRARTPWILGQEVGTHQRIQARAGDLSVEIQAVTIAPVPGEGYFGRNEYTQYFAGELPLVLSAPHGGNQYPSEITDRTYGVTGQDRNTMDLALRIREEIKAQTGHYPHIVVSHLHRSKLDPNREIIEAAQGDSESERAWWEFQTFIDEAVRLVEEDFGEGLYIDLHGHGHEIQRLELGYLLSSTNLANPNEVLSESSFIYKSSFRALGLQAGTDFANLIRGPESLGSLLETEGIPTVPSQSQPDPGGHPFFSGGYNTARHGSRDGGSVSGVQIECNYDGVRDTPENRQALAEALGRALIAFFPAQFGMEFAPLPSPIQK